MKKIIFVFILMLFLCGCSNGVSTNEYQVIDIDPSEVYSLINDKKVYIIDVREVYEYNNGHIKNSHNIPFGQIRNIDNSLVPFDAKIIVYCHSGNRSSNAAKILLEMGYTNVYDMGGITNWEYELISE